MKYSYSDMPEAMKGTFGDVSRSFGFSWKEFVMSVPSPLFLVTSYKSNGKANACMQSWATFTSANKGKGFYAILASVNKNGHLYKSVKERKVAVINFMSADFFDSCMATIKHNDFEADEIAESGLTAESATWVDCPMVKECFMNLECRFAWEKEIAEGDDHAILCLEVVGCHIADEYLDDKTGDKGLLYNVHYPINPEKVERTACDYVAVLQKKIEGEKY